MAQLFASVAGRPRTPRLLVSRRVRMPISCGLLRPTVVLPESMCQAPARRLRWVFLHELTHLERRDAWSALLFALGQAIYFLLPWFWWLRRQVRLCQEYVADAAAAGQDPAADYAEFLLTLTGAPAVPAAATGVSGPTSDLFRRVRMLLQKPVQVEKRCPRRWSLAAAGGLFALAVVVAGVGLRAEASPPVIVIATQDKDAKAEGKQVRVFVLPAPEQKQPGDVILLKKVVDKAEDPIVEGYRKEIARHEQLLADVRARSVNPEQQPVYQSAKAALAEAEKRLAERLHQLRSLPGKELIEIEIRGDKLKIDPKHQDAIRKGLEWLRKTQADKKIELPKGFKFDFNLDGLDLGQEAGQKGIEAGLEAVQKALKELEQHRGQPEVEAARQQLQKVRDRLAELKKARPGFERKVVPAQPIDPQTLQKLREELKKHPEAAELLKALEAFEQKHKVVPDHRHRVWEMWVPDKKGLIVRPAGQAGLGVEVEKPSSALADQLDLPKGQGVVITKVRTDSPAAKAGLRANDVILELNGKPVRNDPVEFAGQVAKLDTAADVTVLRKGKRETVKGIKLAAAEAGIVRWGVRAHEPMVVPFGPMGGRQGDVMTTVLRTEDRFTTRYQEGSLVITVTGTVVGGKAKAGEIHIHDGRADHKYDSVEGVPAQYRDKVNHLLAISAQGQFRIERK